MARGLFSPAEVTALREHGMDLVTNRSDEVCEGGSVDRGPPDPLKHYPRILQPHLKDTTSRRFLLAPRLRVLLTELHGEEPVAVQTMICFKPPGGRGQALHQDQRYLQVSPGTCVAAWLALDDCDPDNGGMRVPSRAATGWTCSARSPATPSARSRRRPSRCRGGAPVDVVMKAGDVLFFLGDVIHGSEPNITRDRFRRVIVGHCATGDARQILSWYAGAMSSTSCRRRWGVSKRGPLRGVVHGEFAFTSTVNQALPPLSTRTTARERAACPGRLPSRPRPVSPRNGRERQRRTSRRVRAAGPRRRLGRGRQRIEKVSPVWAYLQW